MRTEQVLKNDPDENSVEQDFVGTMTSHIKITNLLLKRMNNPTMPLSRGG